MGQFIPISTATNLVLTLDKTDTGKYPQAFVYNTSDALLDTIDLADIGGGIYQNTYTVPALAQGLYVIYKVFSDAGHTTLDTTMPSHATETIFVIGSVTTGSTSFSYTHTVTNSSTAAPIEGANIYIYSDASYTILVTSGVTDSQGHVTTYHDAAGTYYRTILASGFDKANDSITVV